MTEFWENMIYLAMGLISGAAFAIQFTKHRWWTPRELSHYKRLQDEVLEYELRERRTSRLPSTHHQDAAK